MNVHSGRSLNSRTQLTRLTTATLLLAALAAGAAAQAPPCHPCAGIRVEDPDALATLLRELPAIPEEGTLYVSWDEDEASLSALDLESIAARAEVLRELNAVSWPRITLTTPTPILDHVNKLDASLERVAALSGALGNRAHIQIDWKPASGSVVASELAFLIKRSAAAVGGANSDARFIVGLGEFIGGDSSLDFLRLLYEEETAAYVDGVTAGPGSNLGNLVDLLAELAPGTPLVVNVATLGPLPGSSLATSARFAESGAGVVMFEAAEPSAEELAPLVLLAREFAGDISLDPYSTPQGTEAWTFVRGEDLSLRIIANPTEARVNLRFTDSMVRDPQVVRASNSEPESIFGVRSADRALEVTVERAQEPWILRLDRLSAAEIEGLEGLDESLTVTTERTMPVSEILRRLQATEDDQRRRLLTYSARNTTHLRFGGGDEALEATFAGDFFFARDSGWDWAWQDFLINGVRWRAKKIPEIPLVEPEKAAALPLEINFTKEYDYRLRGTEVVNGRDCWVVDFEPRNVDQTKNPYRGTVWVDRQLFVRVRSRALQLGLSGDVISNEETSYFEPLNSNGDPIDWESAEFILPTRTVAQQVFNYLNANTLVEKETLLTELTINDGEFNSRYEAVLASDATMVRDTEQGMRYLIPDEETGERIVQEEFDTTRLFAVGGVFNDDSLDNPIPLGGVNWIDFDFRDTGQQVNVFFAGVLVLANWSDPDFLGSNFTAAADLFGLAIDGTDEIFRDGLEVPGEEVETRSASLSLELGHDIGQRGRAVLDYRIAHRTFGNSDLTDETFIVPADHLEHQVSLRGRYDRAGYRLSGNVSVHSRSDWDPWGTPEQVAIFDPNTDGFVSYGLNLGKTFHLPKFQKIYSELQYVGGSDLDRFSKYNFGYFSDVRVRGYRGGLVRAEEATALHLGYGFDLAEIVQLQLRADGAWATDEASGLDSEFLGGVGIQGNFIGPWNTIVRLDVGQAVAGPDDGVSVFLAVLKLFG